MKKKLVSLLLAGTLASLSLVGCASSESTTTTPASSSTESSTSESASTPATTTSGDTIKIGTISPNTGAMAAYGDAVTKAWELAAKEINEKGGVNGALI